MMDQIYDPGGRISGSVGAVRAAVKWVLYALKKYIIRNRIPYASSPHVVVLFLLFVVVLFAGPLPSTRTSRNAPR